MIPAIENLVEALSRLPTIGRKSAWRLALHLVEQDEEQVRFLADCISGIKDRIMFCRECYDYSEEELCPICASQSRDRTVICVVEKPLDVLTIERSGMFRGLYHVLGGVLSPIDGVTAEKLRITELQERVRSAEVRELILGLCGGADAETTCLYLARVLAGADVRITRLARGLPAGMDLEYVDQITLTQALSGRTDISDSDNPESGT